jgi:lipoprotein-anchoring transpeptidase ErfK/SrfK
MAETIVGAPNIAAIPKATASIKPQEILPVKKPIPTEIIAKAAKALPALPVTSFITLHIAVTKTFVLESVVTRLCAKASDDKTGTIAGTIARKKKDKRAIFAKKEDNFFIVIVLN